MLISSAKRKFFNFHSLFHFPSLPPSLPPSQKFLTTSMIRKSAPGKATKTRQMLNRNVGYSPDVVYSKSSEELTTPNVALNYDFWLTTVKRSQVVDPVVH